MEMKRQLDRIAEPWGTRTPYGPGEEWPVRVDMHLEHGADPQAVRWVETASILHSNGDALEIAVEQGRMAGVRGMGRSRVNHGRLGPKDLYGWQANGSRDRVTQPLVRRDGELVAEAANELTITEWDPVSKQPLFKAGAVQVTRVGESCHAQTGAG